MLKPPPHRGSFSKARLLQVAAGLMKHAPPETYASESMFLKKAKLTLLTGPSKSIRSRFLFGMLSAIIGSSRNHKAPAVWCFNRRWTDREGMKALLQDATSRLIVSEAIPHTDAWIMAIEQIAHSGMIYDTTQAGIGDICEEVAEKHKTAPGKVLIVDGLENFQSTDHEKTLRAKLPGMLNQLKTLAEETTLPVITSCPPLQLLGNPEPLAAADSIIELHDKEDHP